MARLVRAAAPERDRLNRFVRDEIIEAGFAAMRGFLRGERSGSAAARGPPRTIAAGGGVDGVEIVLTRYGGPEVLVPRRVRIREPGAGEARLRQTAVGVNFIDVYCRSGSFDLVAARRRAGNGGGRRRRKRRTERRKRPARRSRRLRLRAAGRLCFDADHADRSPRAPAGIPQRRERRGAAAEGRDRRVSSA